MLISPKKLKQFGVMGINRRNHSYINRYNPRRLFPLVDNKLRTKLLAEEYDIATPALLHVFRSHYEVSNIEKLLENTDKFALKPAKGSGGKGILVVTGRQDGQLIKASGSPISTADLQRHMSNTLAGVYSLAGTPDTILIEDLIECHQSLRDYSFEGVPDIRVIVFKGYPVMAMLRLATKASDGKANLHQGAVGVGLDISTGRCRNAVQYSQTISLHPDNQKRLSDIKVLDWTDLLVFSSRCYEMTGLGYIGVDMVLDQNKGPQLLELNARPGLAIQVANGVGLLPRLRHIESIKRYHPTAEQRVAYVQEQFSQAQYN